MRGPHVSECPLNQALQGNLAILTKVRSDDLAAPTPCMSWDVRALISHFVGTARWWAAAIAGEDAAVDADYAAGDFVGAYEESIRIAVAAFAAEGALDKTARLPFGEFLGVVLRDLAATEQFTHGWDLARAIPARPFVARTKDAEPAPPGTQALADHLRPGRPRNADSRCCWHLNGRSGTWPRPQ